MSSKRGTINRTDLFEEASKEISFRTRASRLEGEIHEWNYGGEDRYGGFGSLWCSHPAGLGDRWLLCNVQHSSVEVGSGRLWHRLGCVSYFLLTILVLAIACHGIMSVFHRAKAVCAQGQAGPALVSEFTCSPS